MNIRAMLLLSSALLSTHSMAHAVLAVVHIQCLPNVMLLHNVI